MDRDNMNKKADFKPYVPAEQAPPELTVTSVVTGILLAVVFGAANAYLGLRVGMTVSASIPAAVVSMGVLRILLRRKSVLESNMVQTIGSAGESRRRRNLYNACVFPVGKGGRRQPPGMLSISLTALLGGLLGVLFMVPLRKALIVKEHGVLPYPEGTACAEVLLAGEKGGTSARAVFAGMGIAALVKFVDGLKVVPSTITMRIQALRTEFSTEIYPALVGVGYICGAKISSYLFAGGILGWFVLIPLIAAFGGETVLYPGTMPIEQNVHRRRCKRHLGQLYPLYRRRRCRRGRHYQSGEIPSADNLDFWRCDEGVKGQQHGGEVAAERTAPRHEYEGCLGRDRLDYSGDCPVSRYSGFFSGGILGGGIWLFFSAVSSRMVGLVGGSNNPVSGMAIATLLFATMVLKSTGDTGAHGMTGAIAIGSIICIIAAMSGDTSQDLKTGYILGATPRRQQLGELVGAAVSAVTIGGVMLLLDTAWGFGSPELSAPQATLMKMIVEGSWTEISRGRWSGLGCLPQSSSKSLVSLCFRWRSDCICRFGFLCPLWRAVWCAM